MKWHALVALALSLSACGADGVEGRGPGDPIDPGDPGDPEDPQPSVDGVMRVDGTRLLDSDGNVFLARGIEGWFGPNAQDNVETLVAAITSQGFNAVRLQLLTRDLGRIEDLIQRFHAEGLVVYLTDANMPEGGDFFGDEATQQMIERNKRNLVIDATIEEPGNGEFEEDVRDWLETQKRVITQFRDRGFTEPLTIGTPNAGRYLRGLLDHGAELIAHDPRHSLVLNCQMYWGRYDNPFSYEELSGFTRGDDGIREAMAAIEDAPFLIQLGLDARDSGGDFAEVPYQLQMTEAQERHIGTMWWQWKDPARVDENSLVADQLDAATLTDLGDDVINRHPASIRKTAIRVTP